MVTRTEIKCDVMGCKKDGWHKVVCCKGWMTEDEDGTYKKLEKPTKAKETDLCDKHWKEWSKLTCKFLKMDKEVKD